MAGECFGKEIIEIYVGKSLQDIVKVCEILADNNKNPCVCRNTNAWIFYSLYMLLVCSAFLYILIIFFIQFSMLKIMWEVLIYEKILPTRHKSFVYK